VDDLVELVVKKTGIDKAQAKVAVETVVNFLKEKLPPPLAGQVDAILSNASVDQAEALIQGVGALLRKK